jgi:hypothetical protein
MYNYMRAVSHSVVAYWLMVICIGELLIVRLFLALFINRYIEVVKAKHCIGEHVLDSDEEGAEDEEAEPDVFGDL